VAVVVQAQVQARVQVQVQAQVQAQAQANPLAQQAQPLARARAVPPMVRRAQANPLAQQARAVVHPPANQSWALAPCVARSGPSEREQFELAQQPARRIPVPNRLEEWSTHPALAPAPGPLEDLACQTARAGSPAARLALFRAHSHSLQRPNKPHNSR
jgi:hypothetical protein